MQEEHKNQDEMNKSRPIFFQYGDPIFGGPTWYMRIQGGYISLGFILNLLFAISVAILIFFFVMFI